MSQFNPIQIDRARNLRKWSPVIEHLFEGVGYLLPYISEEIAYHLEMRQYFNQLNDFMITQPANIPAPESEKLAQFAKNIKTYIEKTVPTTYIYPIELGLNPMSGNLVYKYNGEYLDLKSYQAKSVEKYLKDIDFFNVIGQLYNTDPDILLRKLKLERLK